MPFVTEGLETDSPLAIKLWRVSQVLEVNPFGEEILSLTEAQMDFILTMRSRDRPKELRFERRRDMLMRVRRITESTSRANVLTGGAKTALRDKVSFKIPPQYSGVGTVRRDPIVPDRPRKPPRKPPERKG